MRLLILFLTCVSGQLINTEKGLNYVDFTCKDEFSQQHICVLESMEMVLSNEGNVTQHDCLELCRNAFATSNATGAGDLNCCNWSPGNNASCSLGILNDTSIQNSTIRNERNAHPLALASSATECGSFYNMHQPCHLSSEEFYSWAEACPIRYVDWLCENTENIGETYRLMFETAATVFATEIMIFAIVYVISNYTGSIFVYLLDTLKMNVCYIGARMCVTKCKHPEQPSRKQKSLMFFQECNIAAMRDNEASRIALAPKGCIGKLCDLVSGNDITHKVTRLLGSVVLTLASGVVIMQLCIGLNDVNSFDGNLSGCGGLIMMSFVRYSNLVQLMTLSAFAILDIIFLEATLTCFCCTSYCITGFVGLFTFITNFGCSNGMCCILWGPFLVPAIFCGSGILLTCTGLIFYVPYLLALFIIATVTVLFLMSVVWFVIPCFLCSFNCLGLSIQKRLKYSDGSLLSQRYASETTARLHFQYLIGCGILHTYLLVFFISFMYLWTDYALLTRRFNLWKDGSEEFCENWDICFHDDCSTCGFCIDDDWCSGSTEKLGCTSCQGRKAQIEGWKTSECPLPIPDDEYYNRVEWHCADPNWEGGYSTPFGIDKSFIKQVKAMWNAHVENVELLFVRYPETTIYTLLTVFGNFHTHSGFLRRDNSRILIPPDFWRIQMWVDVETLFSDWKPGISSVVAGVLVLRTIGIFFIDFGHSMSLKSRSKSEIKEQLGSFPKYLYVQGASGSLEAMNGLYTLHIKANGSNDDTQNLKQEEKSDDHMDAIEVKRLPKTEKIEDLLETDVIEGKRRPETNAIEVKRRQSLDEADEADAIAGHIALSAPSENALITSTRGSELSRVRSREPHIAPTVKFESDWILYSPLSFCGRVHDTPDFVPTYIKENDHEIKWYIDKWVVWHDSSVIQGYVEQPSPNSFASGNIWMVQDGSDGKGFVKDEQVHFEIPETQEEATTPDSKGIYDDPVMIEMVSAGFSDLVSNCSGSDVSDFEFSDTCGDEEMEMEKMEMEKMEITPDMNWAKVYERWCQ